MPKRCAYSGRIWSNTTISTRCGRFASTAGGGDEAQPPSNIAIATSDNTNLFSISCSSVNPSVGRTSVRHAAEDLRFAFCDFRQHVRVLLQTLTRAQTEIQIGK